MAEFKEVVHHFRRMVKSREDSGLFGKDGIEKAASNMIAIPDESAALSFERYVMSWAKEHPEVKYPSWADYLMDIGVLEKYQLRNGGYKLISALENSEIPEEIAKKLQIKPVRNEK